MKVSFVLVHRDRKNSAVQCRLRYRGKLYSYNPGVTVEVATFSKGKTTNKIDNLQLRDVEAAMMQAVNYFERKAELPTLDDFRRVVEEFNKGFNAAEIETKRSDLITFIRETFVPDYQFGNVTRGRYLNLAEKLCEFTRKKMLPFEEVTTLFEAKFKRWLIDNDYSKNYVGLQVQTLKTLMRSAREIYHLHENTDYKRFKKESETADTVYLTMEELERINAIDLNSPETAAKLKEWKVKIGPRGLEVVRNKFMIGAICALRISDFSRLSTDNIDGGRIFIMPKKGSSLRKPEPIILPMHPIVRRIIDSGFDLNESISEFHINKGVKVLCRLAGIDQPIIKYITRGGKLVEERKEKWEMVTSHTARRSGATNMDLSGMDRRIIQVCTGHSSQEMLEKYLKASIREVTVGKLEETRYFKHESLRRSQLRKSLHEAVNRLADVDMTDDEVENILKKLKEKFA